MSDCLIDAIEYAFADRALDTTGSDNSVVAMLGLMECASEKAPGLS